MGDARRTIVKGLAFDALLLAVAVVLVVLELRGDGFGLIVTAGVGLGGVAALARLARTLLVLRSAGADGALDPLPETPADAPRADPAEHDRFVVGQAITPLVNRYEVATADADGRPLRPVLHAEQSRWKLREELVFHADQTKAEVVLRLNARSVVDFGGFYDLTDAEGRHVGHLQRQFGASLFRTTWTAQATDGTLVTAVERSLLVAAYRRVVELVPVVGDVLGLIPVPYHFVLRARDDTPVGALTRRRTLRDTYLLDLTGDPGRTLDRRLAIALAVALDALQSR